MSDVLVLLRWIKKYGKFTTHNVPNEVFIMEPFYGGCHKLLEDGLTRRRFCRKWYHSLQRNGIGCWMARCGALQIYNKIPKVTRKKVLWCSTVSHLQEFKKIVYFHENQLIYPVQEIKSGDV
ncbi:hypothetical protein JTB14_025918 [Gonioctena quinquepunctata]|nr:hypothetical protein JTB14_025918 [Gonioctena quinquepunctata]